MRTVQWQIDRRPRILPEKQRVKSASLYHGTVIEPYQNLLKSNHAARLPLQRGTLFPFPYHIVVSIPFLTNISQNASPLPPPPPDRRRRNHNSNTTPRTPKTPKTTPKTSSHTRNKDRPEWSPDKNGMRKPFNQPQPQSILAFRLLAISLLTTCNQNRRNVTRDTAQRLHKRNGVQ